MNQQKNNEVKKEKHPASNICCLHKSKLSFNVIQLFVIFFLKLLVDCVFFFLTKDKTEHLSADRQSALEQLQQH